MYGKEVQMNKDVKNEYGVIWEVPVDGVYGI